MKPLHSRITFPSVVAALGGAEWVSYTAQYAWVKLPGQDQPVRIPRSRVPANAGQWSAFNLADSAASFARLTVQRQKVRKMLRRHLGGVAA